MTLKSLVRPVFAILTYGMLSQVFADDILKQPFTIETEKEVVTAITPDPSPIKKQSDLFAFDWNQSQTIADAKSQIKDEEKFLSTANTNKLSPDDQHCLGVLFFKLGSYYAHVARESDLAIARLMMANTLLTDKQEKMWVNGHLAYAYTLKYELSGNITDKEKALYYSNKVTTELQPHVNNDAAAFAYSLNGLLQNDAGDFKQAEKNLKTALAIYQTTPDTNKDQQARTKTRLANALLGQSGKDKQAIVLLKQAKEYWSTKAHQDQDPYAARNLIALGQAYIKTGKAKAACTEFKTAIQIYKKFYGPNSALLVKPYQLLAQAYKNLGKLDQASAYEKQANDIENA
jgi:tetratricopeptide (TPR) repeat protein